MYQEAWVWSGALMNIVGPTSGIVKVSIILHVRMICCRVITLHTACWYILDIYVHTYYNLDDYPLQTCVCYYILRKIIEWMARHAHIYLQFYIHAGMFLADFMWPFLLDFNYYSFHFFFFLRCCWSCDWFDNFCEINLS